MGATPVATGGGGGGGGSGTVTWVGISVPAEFSATGSPITTAGTLVLAWQSVAANRVMAGPDGVNGTPSFRALVAADIPSLAALYAALSHVHAASDVTSGTFDNARVNWAAPGAIGGTTPAQVTATDVVVTGEVKRTSGNLAIRSVDANVLIYAADTLVGGYTSTARLDYVPLTVAVSSGDTNTVRTLATLSHAISGLAAPGLGVGVNFNTETPTQVTPTTIAKIEATFQSDVDELARISMSARYGAALYEVFRVETVRFGLRNVGLGTFTIAGYPAVAIGSNAQATGSAVAVGRDAIALQSNTVAIGNGANASISNAVAFLATAGIWPANVSGTTTATTGVYGRRGSGTNSAGSDIEIGAGASTGNAVGGSLRLKTAPAGASGSALNALVDRIVITSAGAIGLFGATPVAQAAHIADPTGGATVDAEARTAINAILVVLENIGIAAAS